jgi:DNA-binding HxlR family transcriptional regulator
MGDTVARFDHAKIMTIDITTPASAQDVTSPKPQSTHEVEGCAPARDVMSRVGDRWSMLVVILLGDGSLRFNELMRAIGDVSQRMLSLTLKKLERDGLVSRSETPTAPPRVDYALTALGFSLRMPVKALGQWAIGNHAAIEQARSAFDRRARVGDAQTGDDDPASTAAAPTAGTWRAGLRSRA